MELLSLNDFIDSFELPRSDYNGRQAYDCYNKLGPDVNASFIAREHGVPERTAMAWRNGDFKPRFLKEIDLLQELDLLPLTTNSSLFPYFKELYLFTLLSGSLSQNGDMDSYSLQLSEKESCLINCKEVLDDVFGVECTYNDGSLLVDGNSRGDDSSIIASGIKKLLLLTGCPIGEKKSQAVVMPKFIDADSLLFYCFKLRSYDPMPFRFRIWSTESSFSKETINSFLPIIQDKPFHLVYSSRIHYGLD